MTYQPPPFPAGLRPGSSTPSAAGLQKALVKGKYLSALAIVYTAKYGPITQAGVRRFHQAHPQFGASSDGAIGPRGWAYLMTQVYGTTVPKPVAEPAADYHRVIYGGHTVNVRTRILMQRAEAKLGFKLQLSQGSYHTGVAASAGTHDGGGCIDVSIADYSASKRLSILRAMREVGFAAWIRTPAEGFSTHMHCNAIGDREMASIARAQVRDYFAGRNGLATHGPDTAPSSVGRPYPAWAAKYK
jgi:hypothetical protein